MAKDYILQYSKDFDWMKSGLLYVVRHGSRAYNCHTETSDDDYKGFCVPPKQYYLGNLHRFEQMITSNPDPDIVIFELTKFISLATQANPNVLEVLFVDESDRLFIHPIGDELLDNRDLFISKKIYHTMMGYAHSQLKRMSDHRTWILKPPQSIPQRKDFGLKEKSEFKAGQYDAIKAEVKRKLDKFDFNFLDTLTKDQRIGVKEIASDIITDMKMSVDDMWFGVARTIGLDDKIIELLKAEKSYEKAMSNYNGFLNWKKNRNPARFVDEEKFGMDLKHAYHIVRLINSCEEVLLTGKLIVKRPDREIYMDIRAGKWSYDQVVDFSEGKKEICAKLYETSDVIPHSPDFKKIDNLCISLVEKGFELHERT